MVNIDYLIGKYIYKIIKIENEELLFFLDTGEILRMYHEQDCCEHVYLADIEGDLEDLENSKILIAEENSNWEKEDRDNDDCEKWTFYRLATIKGSVVLRWIGVSNGYYSEDVDLKLYGVVK